ncbi:helix-turn-helix domain-containing protein [Microvirga sp. 0TCS3.31]
MPINDRIEKAKEHLLAGTRPLAEIALAVGFTNQAHFTHSFTRNERISPRLWQRSLSASAI